MRVNLGRQAHYQGDLERAAVLCAESVRLYRTLPDVGGLAYALDCKNIHLVNVEFYTGVGTTLEMPVMLAPVPNVIVAPSVVPGTVYTGPLDHYGLLRTAEEMLGLSCLNSACTAPSFRAPFNL